jgi:hypothetical protein
MIGDSRVWRIPIAICFLVLAASAVYLTTSDYPVEGVPTPRIITDKDVYRWGETIHVEYVLVNEEDRAISFQPPSTLYGIIAGFEGDLNPVIASEVHVTYTCERFTLPPGGVFKVLYQDFPQKRVGNFTIRCGSVTKTVNVLPSDPHQVL